MFQHAKRHIVFPFEVLHGTVGILPTDGKHGQARIHQVLDHGIVRAEIHHIVFVDPRRDHEDWNSADVRRRRGILNEFNELVTVDDFSGRDGQILAHLECAFGNMADPPLLHIGEKILCSLHQVRPAGAQGLLKHHRVRQRKVGRAERIGKLLGPKSSSMMQGRVYLFETVRHVHHPSSGDQVSLLHGVKGQVFAPCLIAETFVGRRTWHILRLDAPQPRVSMGHQFQTAHRGRDAGLLRLPQSHG